MHHAYCTLGLPQWGLPHCWAGKSAWQGSEYVRAEVESTWKVHLRSATVVLLDCSLLGGSSVCIVCRRIHLSMPRSAGHWSAVSGCRCCIHSCTLLCGWLCLWLRLDDASAVRPTLCWRTAGRLLIASAPSSHSTWLLQRLGKLSRGRLAVSIGCAAVCFHVCTSVCTSLWL